MKGLFQEKNFIKKTPLHGNFVFISHLTFNYHIMTFFDKFIFAIMNIFVKWKKSRLNIYIVVI